MSGSGKMVASLLALPCRWRDRALPDSDGDPNNPNRTLGRGIPSLRTGHPRLRSRSRKPGPHPTESPHNCAGPTRPRPIELLRGGPTSSRITRTRSDRGRPVRGQHIPVARIGLGPVPRPITVRTLNRQDLTGRKRNRRGAIRKLTPRPEREQHNPSRPGRHGRVASTPDRQDKQAHRNGDRPDSHVAPARPALRRSMIKAATVSNH